MKVVIDLSLRQLADLIGISPAGLKKRLSKHLVNTRLTLGKHSYPAIILDTDTCDTESKHLVNTRLTLGKHQEENPILSPLQSSLKPKEEVPPIEEKNIINNIQKETSPKNQAKRVDDLSQYEWADDELREVLQEWVDYKRKIGKTYKTEMGLKKLHTQVVKWSKGSPEILRKIVDQSLANNWQGLFELKDEYKEEVGVVLHEQPKTIEDYGYDW